MKGSITIFLALLLPVFLIFTGACLEYARAQALSYQVQAAAASAVQSIFAGYSSPLLSQYQLTVRLVAQGDFDALAEEGGRYVSAYGEEEGGMVSFQTSEILWQDLVFVTDDHGAVFTALVGDAMTASAVELVAKEWLERLGLSGDVQQTETLTENAARDTLSVDDLLSGYTEWEASVEEAETSLAEVSGETEEENPEEVSGDTEDAPGNSPEEGGEASGGAERGEEEQSAADRERGAAFLKVLSTLRQAVQHGILGFVLPEGKSISSGVVAASDLPSSLSEEAKSRSVGDSLSSTGDSLLLREYLMRNLDCFTSESGKSPAYELEYVLAGKSTDEANLRSAVTRILWIRTGMNLLYLSGSAEKRAQLQEAAALAVGWLGQPALVTGMAALLQIAWAFSESIMDVRSLLDGGKIPLSKTDESWTLSLDGLAEIWTGEAVNPDRAEEEEENGLSYEDYLRICLYLTSEETCCYRAMDVIQWNVQTMDPSFVLTNCVVSGTLCLTAEASPLFVPLYGNVAGVEAFIYTKSDHFSYLT